MGIIETLLKQAELVIWLKAPRWKCILNVVKRYFR